MRSVQDRLAGQGRHTRGLMSVFFDLTEGIHNDSQQEVEQHHEDQQLKGPEEEGGRHSLQALQLVQVIVHADVSQQNGKACVHCRAKCGELLHQTIGQSAFHTSIGAAHTHA